MRRGRIGGSMRIVYRQLVAVLGAVLGGCITLQTANSRAPSSTWLSKSAMRLSNFFLPALPRGSMNTICNRRSRLGNGVPTPTEFQHTEFRQISNCYRNSMAELRCIFFKVLGKNHMILNFLWMYFMKKNITQINLPFILTANSANPVCVINLGLSNIVPFPGHLPSLSHCF